MRINVSFYGKVSDCMVGGWEVFTPNIHYQPVFLMIAVLMALFGLNKSVFPLYVVFPSFTRFWHICVQKHILVKIINFCCAFNKSLCMKWKLYLMPDHFNCVCIMSISTALFQISINLFATVSMLIRPLGWYLTSCWFQYVIIFSNHINF